MKMTPFLPRNLSWIRSAVVSNIVRKRLNDGLLPYLILFKDRMITFLIKLFFSFWMWMLEVNKLNLMIFILFNKAFITLQNFCYRNTIKLCFGYIIALKSFKNQKEKLKMSSKFWTKQSRLKTETYCKRNQLCNLRKKNWTQFTWMTHCPALVLRL